MAGATIRDYLIGSVFFSLVIIAGISILASVGESDASLLEDARYGQYNATFNKLGDVQEVVGDIETSITESEPNLGVFGVLNALVEMAWNGVKLFFTSFGFMNSVFTGLTSFFGLPWYVGASIILIVTIIIAFSIYSAIFQREL